MGRESGTVDPEEPRELRERGRWQIYREGGNSVCKVMQRARIRIERAEEGASSPRVARVYLCIAWLLCLRTISRISQYITEVRARGCRTGCFYLVLLLLLLLRLLCWSRYRGGETPASAREMQQRIVHTVLIGIHCQSSDLCQRPECRSNLTRYLKSFCAHFTSPVSFLFLHFSQIFAQVQKILHCVKNC